MQPLLPERRSMANITLLSAAAPRAAPNASRNIWREKLEAAGFLRAVHGPLLGSVFRDLADNPYAQPETFRTAYCTYEDLQTQKPDLSAVRFGAISIVSREYDTFLRRD